MAYMPASQAAGFGDMMNPSKWMGGKKDYDDYGPGGYGGPGGPAPYGRTTYGGAPPGSYGQAPATAAPSAPQPSVDQSARIRKLERRIAELEAEKQRQQPTPLSFRPSTSGSGPRS